MAGVAEHKTALVAAVDGVADREVLAVLLLHLERLVQGLEDRPRVAEVRVRQRLRRQHIDG
jgi:hypothetical protein